MRELANSKLVFISEDRVGIARLADFICFFAILGGHRGELWMSQIGLERFINRGSEENMFSILAKQTF